MPDLLAGTTVLGADTPPSQSDFQATSGTTTSTTYTATLTGGTACGLVFTAPTSGRVLVCNNTAIVNSATQATYCSFAIRAGGSIGSGTVFLSEADGHAILNTTTSNARYGTTRVVEGLTPGSTYNAQQLFRVAASTGTYVNKSLHVIPLP
jgi:hypothetical protein